MPSTGFVNTIVETTIHLLPSKLSNLEEGIRSVLSRMLMTYVINALWCSNRDESCLVP